MAVYVLSFLFLLLIVTAMSVGVLLGRKPIKGSCGGMSALGMGTACDICGGDQARCDEEQMKPRSTDADALAYEASDATQQNR